MTPMIAIIANIFRTEKRGDPIGITGGKKRGKEKKEKVSGTVSSEFGPGAAREKVSGTGQEKVSGTVSSALSLLRIKIGS